MKVLKKGRPQKGWSIEAKCTGSGNKGGGCGALLLVEQGDLFRTSSSSMGEVDHYVTFKCSDCGVLTDLPRGTQPPYEVVASLLSHREWEREHGK